MASAPLPPQLAGQQSPEGAQSVFAQQGLPKPGPGMQVVAMAVQKLKAVEQAATELAQVLQQIAPQVMPMLAPMISSGKDIEKALQDMVQRSGMAQGSPVVEGQPPMNPAAGPPNPNAL